MDSEPAGDVEVPRENREAAEGKRKEEERRFAAAWLVSGAAGPSCFVAKLGEMPCNSRPRRCSGAFANAGGKRKASGREFALFRERH